MNTFDHHEPCPNCGSRDNVGVWSDSHKYCFGCGYGVPGYKGLSLKDLKQQLKQEDNKKSGNPVDSTSTRSHLPSDFSYGLPPAPLTWLRKYEITDEEIARHRIGWSDVKQSLVLPVFDDSGNLLYVQTRYFGRNESYPKYVTSGESEKIFAVMDVQGRRNSGNVRIFSSSFCVLVEDFISAIRVGRQFPCMPLFGSNISIYRLRKLSDHFSNLGIWLDRDKLKEAIKARFRATPYFDSVNVIVADKDPKEHDDDEIQRIVTRSRADDRGFSC